MSYQRIIASDGDNTETGSFPFTLTADGYITATVPDGTVRGAVAADRMCFAINKPDPGEVARLDLCVRRGSGMGVGALDGNYWLIGADQSCIGSHERHLGHDLDALAKGAQRERNDLVYLVGSQFLSHGTAHAAKGMLAGEDSAPGGLDCCPVLISEARGVWYR